MTGSPLEIDYAARVLGDVEQQLDGATFTKAWEEGQRLAIATAVGLATS